MKNKITRDCRYCKYIIITDFFDDKEKKFIESAYCGVHRSKLKNFKVCENFEPYYEIIFSDILKLSTAGCVVSFIFSLIFLGIKIRSMFLVSIVCFLFLLIFSALSYHKSEKVYKKNIMIEGERDKNE